MPILAWLASAFASFLGYSAVRFVAWKVVVYALVTTVVPIVLMNVFYSVIQNSMNLLNTAQSQGGVSGVVLNYTGLAAWLVLQFRLPECLSVFLSALLFRVMIRMIPFVRL